MSRTTKVWIAAAVALVVGAAAGTGVTYTLQRDRVTQLQRELDNATGALADATGRIAALEASAQVSAPEPAPEPTTTPAPEKPEAPKTPQKFAFIAKVTAGGSSSLSADYAEYLTGDAAATAAKKRGDESPPPNDYYIVNDSRATTTLKVDKNVKVHLVSNPDGTSDPAGYDSDFETWSNYFAAPSDENAGIRGAGYWLSIKDGVVIAIDEQFLP